MPRKYYLRFVGWGAIPGIPGRDLTIDEIADRDLDPEFLLSTKLWVKQDGDPPAPVVDAEPLPFEPEPADQPTPEPNEEGE